jgi:tetratricopeptide (TPR) repeat protein
MARKKRRFDQAPAPAPQSETEPKPRHQDAFQRTVGQRIEDAGRKLEGQGRNILYGLGALAVLGIIVWIIYAWMGKSNAEAQTALGRAIETSQATITQSPLPVGSTAKTFPTQAERAQAAIAEFQAVADKFGGEIAEKAKYFIAVNRLVLDRGAAIQELQALKDNSGEVGSLAKFALAQALAGDGNLDEAAALYQDLMNASDPVVAKETVGTALADIYEKQGKNAEAAAVLFDIVKSASEAKDPAGEPIPLNSTAREAKDKLERLDPEKAKELPDTGPADGEFPLNF